ncbi:Outer membrane protein TolC [Burkholderiales bacterium 8X]|nr:Outer membrane protein TolC [Burkholderiales bacterium 8X]
MKPVPSLVCCVLAGITSIGGALPAFAQSASPVPRSAPEAAVSIAQAVEAAWLRAVEAREADAQAVRARADQVAASSLSAGPPALELSHLDDRLHSNAGRRETEVGIAWPLWLPGQRDARRATADAALRMADLQFDVMRLRLAGQVHEAAWKLAAAQAESQAYGTQRQYLQRIADDVQRRVGAGDLARSDALVARAELLEAESAEIEAAQRRAALRLQWRSLTGLEALPAMPSPAMPSADPPEGGTHPELRLAMQAVEHAQRKLDAVNVSRRDAPELSVKYRQEAPGLGERLQRGVGVGIRIPFGTDGRNAPLQAAAIGELDVADTNAQRLRDRLDADLQTARTAARDAARQLASTRERATLLRERAELVEISFKAGETPLPDLLRAANAATQADAALARQQAALGLAQARLQQASGRFP